MERRVLRQPQPAVMAVWRAGCGRVLHSVVARTGRGNIFAAVAAGTVAALVTSGEISLNLTKTKRSRIGFKTGGNGRKGLMAIMWVQGCKNFQRKMRRSRNLIEKKENNQLLGLLKQLSSFWEGQL